MNKFKNNTDKIMHVTQHNIQIVLTRVFFMNQ